MKKILILILVLLFILRISYGQNEVFDLIDADHAYEDKLSSTITVPKQNPYLIKKNIYVVLRSHHHFWQTHNNGDWEYVEPYGSGWPGYTELKDYQGQYCGLFTQKFRLQTRTSPSDSTQWQIRITTYIEDCREFNLPPSQNTAQIQYRKVDIDGIFYLSLDDSIDKKVQFRKVPLNEPWDDSTQYFNSIGQPIDETYQGTFRIQKIVRE